MESDRKESPALTPKTKLQKLTFNPMKAAGTSFPASLTTSILPGSSLNDNLESERRMDTGKSPVVGGGANIETAGIEKIEVFQAAAENTSSGGDSKIDQSMEFAMNR